MPTSSYDIEKIFEDIEKELLDGMMRNFKKHQVRQISEGLEWTQWQAEMIQGLEEYKRRNYTKFKASNKKIEKMLDKAIREAGLKGANDEQKKALQALRKGVPIKHSNTGINASFFGVNDDKMNALIKSINNDLTTARASVLRLAEDDYRQVMFKAQAYASSGAGTYAKAVDMATKDFISKGITAIIYSNGARHTIEDYSKMAIRTANKRAYLMGAGAKREEWGVHTVIVNIRNREEACPKCAQFIGHVLIDDVYSGGTFQEAQDTGYMLLSEAMAQGLFHPNCKDSLSTYYPELYEDGDLFDPATDGLSEMEQHQLIQREAEEQRENYIKRQVQMYERLAYYSLDNENKDHYRSKVEYWLSKITK